MTARQVDPPSPDDRGLALGLLLAGIGVWVWAAATAPSVVRVPADGQQQLASPGPAFTIVPMVVMIAGFVIGSGLWTVWRQHRIPRPSLDQPRSRAWPTLVASASMFISWQVTAWVLPTWSAHPSRDGREIVVRTIPVDAAVVYTVGLITWAVVYALGRWIMGDDDLPEPEETPRPAAGERASSG